MFYPDQIQELGGSRGFFHIICLGFNVQLSHLGLFFFLPPILRKIHVALAVGLSNAENNLVKANFCFLYFSDHQAKAVLKFIEAISEKTLRSTVALTAARGRGKSAALGLAIAGAVAFGWGMSPVSQVLFASMNFLQKKRWDFNIFTHTYTISSPTSFSFVVLISFNCCVNWYSSFSVL